MLKHATKALAIVAFTTLVGCGDVALPTAPPDIQALTISLHHTTTTAALTNDLVSAYQNILPDVQFRLSSSNYVRAIDQIRAGTIPYLVTPYLPAETTLWAAPVARDGIAVVTHRQNPVQSLSTEQLQRIFRGFITNWDELGGEDQPIVLYSRDANSGMHLEFERSVMGQQRISPNALVLPDNAAVVQRISQQTNAVGYVPLTQVDTIVKALRIDGVDPTRNSVRDNRYPLRYTIYVVGQQAPEGPYLDFVSWVQSEAGQRVVANQAIPLPS